MIFHTSLTEEMSAPLEINILMTSRRLLKAAQCNAVQPSCSNKNKEETPIKCTHYTDKFQLNVLVTHNTLMILIISCKHPIVMFSRWHGTITVMFIHIYYCSPNILHY